CGCCRRIWPHMPESARAVVARAERYADRVDTGDGLSVGEEADIILQLSRDILTPNDPDCLAQHIFRAAEGTIRHEMNPLATDHAAAEALEQVSGGRGDTKANAIWRTELKEQASLLKDIFGNPFQPTEFSSEWPTDTA